MLTGKCKTDFENWYLDNRPTDNYGNDIHSILNEMEYEFTDYPFSMQYGVYVDFFDSVGIYIHSELLEFGFDMEDTIHISQNQINYHQSHPCYSRHEARQKAIQYANDYYNKNKAK